MSMLGLYRALFDAHREFKYDLTLLLTKEFQGGRAVCGQDLLACLCISCSIHTIAAYYNKIPFTCFLYLCYQEYEIGRVNSA